MTSLAVAIMRQGDDGSEQLRRHLTQFLNEVLAHAKGERLAAAPAPIDPARG